MLLDRPAPRATKIASQYARRIKIKPEWPSQSARPLRKNLSIALRWPLSTSQVIPNPSRWYRSDLKHLCAANPLPRGCCVPTLLIAFAADQNIQFWQAGGADQHSSISWELEAREHQNDDILSFWTQIHGILYLTKCLMLGEPHSKLLFVDTFKNKALA